MQLYLLNSHQLGAAAKEKGKKKSSSRNQRNKGGGNRAASIKINKELIQLDALCSSCVKHLTSSSNMLRKLRISLATVTKLSYFHSLLE